MHNDLREKQSCAHHLTAPREHFQFSSFSHNMLDKKNKLTTFVFDYRVEYSMTGDEIKINK
jgi:hypothetical protein